MTMLSHTLEGKLTLSGLLEPMTYKDLTGMLRFKGELISTELTVCTIDHALSFYGSLTKQARRSLVSSVDFHSELAKQSTRKMNGAIKMEGSLECEKNPPTLKHRVMNWLRRGHH